MINKDTRKLEFIRNNVCTLVALKGKNYIVQIIAVTEDNDNLCIIMERADMNLW